LTRRGAEFGIKCPVCHSEQSPDAVTCSSCGTVLMRAPISVARPEPLDGRSELAGMAPLAVVDGGSDRDLGSVGLGASPLPRTPVIGAAPATSAAGSEDAQAVAPALDAPPFAAIPSRRTRAWVWLLVGLGIVVFAWAGYATYGLRANHDHAERWRQRSLVLQEQADGMSRLLAARTSQLNVRIDQINGLAVKLRNTQDALGRSEGDVGTLDARQRALANEKAQVEDERAALLRTAALYRICKSDLLTLLTDLANSDYASATAHIPAAQADCAAADESLGG
jgi:hypothetical protein